MMEIMTKLLDKAIQEARWAKKFAETQHVLEKLADEALAEIKAGRTAPLDFSRLR